MDRAAAFEAEGRGFESLQARQPCLKRGAHILAAFAFLAGWQPALPQSFVFYNILGSFVKNSSNLA